jgi:hypothetical protein
MRFSALKKGRRARKLVRLRVGEETAEFDVRVLGNDDDIEIASEAVRLSKEKGLLDPAPGTEVYDRFERAVTVFLACVDHDSPETAPAPYFASVDEVLTDHALTRDHIAMIVEEQARFQSESSPRPRSMSTADYVRLIAKCAEGDIGPFAETAPGLQWSFVRRMASQLLASQTPKSPSSSSPAGT